MAFFCYFFVTYLLSPNNASKKTYKKKQAANPLYQVFTTYYNRIYGRIRWGTLDKDLTLLDNIKILHQEFATKYDELADKNEKEKLIQEFTSSAENLIKQQKNQQNLHSVGLIIFY